MQELIDYTGASFMSLKILSHCFVSNIIEIHFAKHLFTPLLTYDNQLIYIFLIRIQDFHNSISKDFSGRFGRFKCHDTYI